MSTSSRLERAPRVARETTAPLRTGRPAPVRAPTGAPTHPEGLVELLGAVLGGRRGDPDALERAARVVAELGGEGGLAAADVPSLVAAGLPRLAAHRLVAALALGRRVLQGCPDGPWLASHDAVVRWAAPRLSHLEHEEVWGLLLDGRNRLRSAVRVAQGGLHACALTPADVLRPAIRSAASALVLVHNHPSGDPSPSGEDLALTRALSAACQIVAVPLLDHVIVARGGNTSLVAGGHLDARQR